MNTNTRDWADDAAEEAMLLMQCPVIGDDGKVVFTEAEVMRVIAARIRTHYYAQEPNTVHGGADVQDSVHKLLSEIAQYAPAYGVLSAPTAMMGFGSRARHFLSALAPPSAKPAQPVEAVTDASVEQAGKVVAYRLWKNGESTAYTNWMDGKPQEDMLDIYKDNGRSVEYAYSHSSTLGVPDGWKYRLNVEETKPRWMYTENPDVITEIEGNPDWDIVPMLAAAPAPGKE